MSLVPDHRYIQIAFNHTLHEVNQVLPLIPRDPRILIEAGTPFIKREGVSGIQYIRRYWSGIVLADLKVSDGATEEIIMAGMAGANAATALGSAPTETLNKFCEICRSRNIYSFIDMLGVEYPLKKLMELKNKPNGVVIHKGRDEESNKQKLIRYRDINRIRSKFPVLISVAGGLNPDRIRSAYFNGANIAIINIVLPSDLNEGIKTNDNIRELMAHGLNEVGE